MTRDAAADDHLSPECAHRAHTTCPHVKAAVCFDLFMPVDCDCPCHATDQEKA